MKDRIKKFLNLIFPFIDFLYILQLDEYYPKMYFKRIWRFYFRRDLQKRGNLKFTQRIKTTFSFSLVISLVIISVITFTLPLHLFFALPLGVLVSALMVPLSVGVANLLATPIYNLIKRRIQNEARNIIQNQGKNTKIIAIAGSYGKTSTKNFIYQLIKSSYKVQIVPGNINTPTGIAVWINENFNPSTEFLIVEMDAYEIGEIAASCRITPPDIAVLTVIGDQHTERFGKEENMRIALQEVFTKAKQGAYLITDKETKYKLSNDLKEKVKIIRETGDVRYKGNPLNTKGLSESKIKCLRYALAVAEILNIPYRYVVHTVNNLEIPEQRQKITKMMEYEGIDDSYNISFTTAMMGLKTARKEADKRGKRLLVITAGIPELSKENRYKNTKYGRALSRLSDRTIVLKSILAKDVIKGFSDKSKYILVPNMEHVTQLLKEKFSKDRWFILLQPELTDLYY